MVLSGVLALLVGAILTFAVHGHVGDVGVNTLGAVTMVLGALILIAGLIRLGGRSVVRRTSGRVVAGRSGAGRSVARNAGGVVTDRVYKTGKGKIAAMVVAVIYIVSPIDFIPDFLLPFGVIDDATAFTWLIFAIGQEFNRHRQVL